MLWSNWSSPITHFLQISGKSILLFQLKFVSSKCGFPHQKYTVSWSLPLWTPLSHPPLHVLHQLWCPIFTTSSYTINPLEPVPSSFNYIPLSLTSQLTTHARYISLPCMIFECRHNIRNQPVSTTKTSPSSFRDITTIRKHWDFGEILKYVFLIFFKIVSHIANTQLRYS